MKKFIIHLLSFSVFALFFYVIGLALWSWIMPNYMAKNVRNCIGCYGHLNTRIKEIPNYKDIDILILGSSHAYRGFDTRVFKKHGINAFNLGSSAQSPIQTYILLNQYLDELNPKLVVLEVYAGVLELDGVESSLDLAANNKMDKYYYQTLKDIRNLQTYNSTIYGTFRELFHLNDNFKEDSIQEESRYIKGGYVESEYKQNPLLEEKTSKWVINPTQIHYLDKTINLLKDKNIDYILVQTPISKKLYEAKTNNKEIDSLLSSKGKYFSFQNKIELNDTTDFYDSNHLNQKAVERFSEMFIQFLKNRNLISKL